MDELSRPPIERLCELLAQGIAPVEQLDLSAMTREELLRQAHLCARVLERLENLSDSLTRGRHHFWTEL